MYIHLKDPSGNDICNANGARVEVELPEQVEGYEILDHNARLIAGEGVAAKKPGESLFYNYEIQWVSEHADGMISTVDPQGNTHNFSKDGQTSFYRAHPPLHECEMLTPATELALGETITIQAGLRNFIKGVVTKTGERPEVTFLPSHVGGKIPAKASDIVRKEFSRYAELLFKRLKPTPLPQPAPMLHMMASAAAAASSAAEPATRRESASKAKFKMDQ